MATLTKGIKHAKFKLRASGDLPSQDFKVEFTPRAISISKKGARDANHLRWCPLIGHMVLFGGEAMPIGQAWRGFDIEIKPAVKALASERYTVEFCDKGVRIFVACEKNIGLRTFWSWRTLWTVSIVGF